MEKKWVGGSVKVKIKFLSPFIKKKNMLGSNQASSIIECLPLCPMTMSAHIIHVMVSLQNFKPLVVC
jgi:hypothetical protein